MLQSAKFIKDFITDNRARRQENDVLLFIFLFTHLHTADVNASLAQFCPDLTDDTRLVLIMYEENVPFRDGLKVKVVDAQNSGHLFAKNGTSNDVFPLQGAYREFDEAGKIL